MITIRYNFPIPQLKDLFDKLHGPQVLSHLDLQNGYHQIRIFFKDERKIAFKTREGTSGW